MRFQICIIQPDNYVHSGAFLEIADLLKFALLSLGHEVVLKTNNFDSTAQNILIGVHLLDASVAAQLPPDTIILNTEQLGGVCSNWNENIIKWFSNNFTLWDYSHTNVGYLKDFGIKNVKKLEIGYQEELNRIKKQDTKNVDVLFYGMVNERRRKALQELEARGLRVKTLVGVYGAGRDLWVGQSQLVVNLHYFETQIFEIVRIFYLMTNGIPVATEINTTTKIDDFYREGLYCRPYEEFVDGVVELFEDKKKLAELGPMGQERIKLRPQTELLQNIL